MAIVFGGDSGLTNDSFTAAWGQMKEQFSNLILGAKQLVSWDNLIDGRPAKENVYVDDGHQNVPGTSFVGGQRVSGLSDVKMRRITTQAPQATVYIKKRLFWSLRNEHDYKFMDSDENLFIRASKRLFERKAAQMAAYESLTKLQSLVEEETELDVARIEEVIVGLEGVVSEYFYSDPEGTATVEQLEGSEKILEELKGLVKKVKLSKQATTTNWVIDPDDIVNNTKTGRGTGVIEITSFTSISTSLALDPGNLGLVNLSIEDPYGLMGINESDIETALSAALDDQRWYKYMDSSGSLGGGGAERLNSTTRSAQEILEEARVKDELLKRTRRNRWIILNKGNPVGTSDPAELVFEVQPGSGASEKVTARITASSEVITKNNFATIFAQLKDSRDKLTYEETQLVKEIFQLLDKYVLQITRMNHIDKAHEEDKAYARRQMRKFYLGRQIIQPMDGIHIYMRGNTTRDDEIIGPVSSKFNSIPFIRTFQSALEPDGAADAVLEEEMRQFGINPNILPVDVYRTFRTSSLMRNAGTHVFGGLVSRVQESYTAEKGYTLSVSGENNLKWLNMSKVNVRPALDQAEAVLEDPITPLDIEVDSATGLIQGVKLSKENLALMNDKILFYNAGTRRYEAANPQNINQSVSVQNGITHPVRFHPPGLKYKWKEGIIVASRNVNLGTAINQAKAKSLESQAVDVRREYGRTLTTTPFANQDIADTVSLLVTGYPHNYEAFYLNSLAVGTFIPGQNNGPESYFHSFFDIQGTKNRAFGNFQPFKSIVFDSEAMSKALALQTQIRNNNSALQKAQSELVEAQDKLSALKQNGASDEELSKAADLAAAALNRVSAFADQLAKNIESGKDSGLRVYGNMIDMENVGKEKTLSDSVKKRMANNKLRSRLLQMRPQLSTKLNTDTNLFIVSDQYDKDLDLQAFVTELGDLETWSSQFQDPLEICIKAANIADLEMFCDTQGHIQLRPPEYNKIPVSLLAKMLLLKDRGVEESKKFPAASLLSPFVANLFVSRLQAVQGRVESLQLEVAIENLYLGREATKIDDIADSARSANVFVDSIVLPFEAETGDAQNFTKVAMDIATYKNQLAQRTGSSWVTQESINDIEAEIRELNDPKTKSVNSKRKERFSKLVSLVGELSRAQDLENKIIDPKRQGERAMSALGDAAGAPEKSLSPGQLAEIFEPFGYLLEDDTNDFLGPGSSSRYIIYDDQVISWDFDESDSNVQCRVDVTGQEDLVGEGAGRFAGMPLLWAGAVDYDLWKQYGYRSYEAVSKPFFKNPDTQCAPYAMMILNRQRRDIIRATVKVAGNEYYQLGDVVYVASKGLLFYVYRIDHSFQYGSGFTTTLALRYGRPLGEFIPNPLDVIGKNIIKNQTQFNTNFMFRKTSGLYVGRFIGAVMFSGYNDTTTVTASEYMLSGGLEKYNLIVLRNALISLLPHLNSENFDKVEIRGFMRNESQSTRVKKQIDAVAAWLQAPVTNYSTGNIEDNLIKGLKPLSKDQIIKVGPVLLEANKDGFLEAEVVPFDETYSLIKNPKDEIEAIELAVRFKEVEE